MQFPGQAPVVGVVYSTTMSRADSALALALLYGLGGKREARLGAISVMGAGLQTAAFCDAVGRFYSPGPLANSNRVLPVGLAPAGSPSSVGESGETVKLSPDSAMVKSAMERLDEKGGPAYPHGTARWGDTSEPCALIRNALTAQADAHAVVLVSSPATYVARVLQLQGVRELIAAKVRGLILCGSEAFADAAAARTLLTDWPSPIVYVPKEIGEAVLFPASSIEKDFGWSPINPVVDAYRAYRPMPYDANTLDLAAMLYAARPNTDLFQTGAPGTLTVGDQGQPAFAPNAEGKHRSLQINPEKKQEILKQFIELATAKPVQPPARRSPTAAKPVVSPKTPEATKPPLAIKPTQPE